MPTCKGIDTPVLRIYSGSRAGKLSLEDLCPLLGIAWRSDYINPAKKNDKTRYPFNIMIYHLGAGSLHSNFLPAACAWHTNNLCHLQLQETDIPPLLRIVGVKLFSQTYYAGTGAEGAKDVESHAHHPCHHLSQLVSAVFHFGSLSKSLSEPRSLR